MPKEVTVIHAFLAKSREVVSALMVSGPGEIVALGILTEGLPATAPLEA